MFCKNCGSEIDDNSVVCPNCGTAMRDTYVAQPTEKNTLAVVGLVLAFIMPLVGLIISIMAKKKAEELNGDGKGLATAGLIVSIVYMVIAVISVIIVMALIGAGVAAGVAAAF